MLLSSPSIDGSALYQQGNTRVLCSVSGPRELSERRRDESGVERETAKVVVELRTAAFAGSARRAKRRVDRRQTEMELLIKDSLAPLLLLHLFPNSEISIALDILQDDGGALPCAVNAATVALLNAGIPLNDVLLATHIALVPPPTSDATAAAAASTVAYADASAAASVKPVGPPPVLLLDPPLHEVGPYHPSLQVGVGCVSGRVSFMVTAGKLPVSALEAALAMATTACRAIQREMNEEVRRSNEAILHTRGRVHT